MYIPLQNASNSKKNLEAVFINLLLIFEKNLKHFMNVEICMFKKAFWLWFHWLSISKWGLKVSNHNSEIKNLCQFLFAFYILFFAQSVHQILYYDLWKCTVLWKQLRMELDEINAPSSLFLALEILNIEWTEFIIWDKLGLYSSVFI